MFLRKVLVVRTLRVKRAPAAVTASVHEMVRLLFIVPTKRSFFAVSITFRNVRVTSKSHPNAAAK